MSNIYRKLSLYYPYILYDIQLHEREREREREGEREREKICKGL